MMLATASAASAQSPATPAIAPPSAKTLGYLQAIGDSLGQPAAGALARISGVDRQLLAARSYLRSGTSLASRWSWPQERIDRYPESDEYRAAMAEIDKVKAAFARANPGYELYVNVEVRSLDVQLARWNGNTSVARAARAVLSASDHELASYPAEPDTVSRKRFAAFLVAWHPDPPPNLAAPGLSPHGQSRAYDFQVHRNGELVAGTDASQIAADWDGGQWRARLAAAVAAAGGRFQGPLAAPDEPWHYQYTP